MANYWTVIGTLVLAAFIQVAWSQVSSHESRLFETLAGSYKTAYKSVRPVSDHENNVTVGIGITLIDIQDFDPSTGFGTFFCFDKLTWKDEHLTWNPRQYGEITTLRMPIDMIWRPDIVLYNSQDMNEDRFQSMTVVDNNGKVLWIPRTKYHIRCYEPEDGSAQFECKFKFGSWVYNGYMLDPVLYNGVNKTDVAEFFANHQWEIVDNYAEKKVEYYDCCPEPYPSVYFYLKLNYKGPVNGAGHVTSSAYVAVLAVMAAVTCTFF